MTFGRSFSVRYGAFFVRKTQAASRLWISRKLSLSLHAHTETIKQQHNAMENKLQQLTQKLYDEGLEKGRAEADKLVAEAKAQE